MARFIPDLPADQISHDSERLVYEALQGLPDGYLVLHSYPWLRPDRDLEGKPLREGEADFVILHRDRGLLVLEVKGGEPRLDGRSWWRGGKRMRDPFVQAQRNLHALLDAVEERTRGRLTREAFVFGHAVVFPHAAYQGDLPANARREVFFDMRDLADLPARIERAYRAYTGRPRPLSKAQLGQLRDVLLPKLRVVRCVGPDLERAEAQLIQLTELQQRTLAGLFANRRVLVEGVAGSGKTLLALERAVTLAEEGARVQLLCYNRQLAEWLGDRLAQEPRLDAAAGEVRVGHFHGLALDLARQAGVEVEPPQRRSRTFWEHDAASILDHAVGLLRGTEHDPTVDALVIDEAQDFAAEWWLALEELLSEPQTGTMYVFIDLAQGLREGSGEPPVELPTRFRLSTNCRNTQRIALPGALVAHQHIDLLPGAPVGERVRLVRATSPADQPRHVEETVAALLDRAGLTPGQVVLIGPAAWEHGSLVGVARIAGVPLVTDARDWRAGKGLLCTTARSFKGLESDAAVVYDLDGLGGLFTTSDLYVAWTRAKHLLTLICHGDTARAAVEAALSQAGSPS